MGDQAFRYDRIMSPGGPVSRDLGGVNALTARPPDPSLTFVDHTGQLSGTDLKHLGIRLQQCEYDAVSHFNTYFSRKAARAWRNYYGFAPPAAENWSEETGRELMTAVDRMVEVLMRATFDQETLLAFTPDGNRGGLHPLARPMNDYDCHLVGRHVEAVMRNAPEARAVFERFAITGLVEGVSFLRADTWQPPDETVTLRDKTLHDVHILSMDPTLTLLRHAQEYDPAYPNGVKFHLHLRRKVEPRTLVRHVPNSRMLWPRDCVFFDQDLPDGPGYMGLVDMLAVNEIIRQVPRAVAHVTGAGDDEINRVLNDPREQIFSEVTGDMWSSLNFGDDSFPGRQQRALIHEYTRFDLDGDGVDELVCTRRIANRILYVAPVSSNPFSSWVPKENPARAIGQSLDDKLDDIEGLNTDLTRAMMNLTGMIQTPRVGVNMAQNPVSDISPEETLADYQVAGVGGIVRTGGDPNTMIAPLQEVHPENIRYIAEVRDQVRSEGAERVGVGKSMRGLSDSDLGRTATGMHMGQQAGVQPARALVEAFGQGLVRCAQKVLKCEINNGRPVMVKSNGRFVQADPRYWTHGLYCSVNLSGAILNADQRIAHLSQMLNLSVMTMQELGPDNPVIGLRQFANAYREMVRTMGFSDAQRFIGDVTDEDIAQIAQAMAAQGEEEQVDPSKMAKVEADFEIDQMKLQLEADEMQMKAQIEMLKLAIESENKRLQIATEAQIEVIRQRMEERLEQKKLKDNKQIALDKNKQVSIGQKVRFGGAKTG